MTDSHAPAPSLAAFLRRADPDRYFCTLFAPAAHRETLFTLYAFNHELARACEVTREPGLALIRLHWWREVVEGQAKSHEVATPLHAALANGRLSATPLLAMIEARDREAEAGFATAADWAAWLHLGPGSLAAAAAAVLGAPPDLHGRFCTLGAGIGAAGQLRNIGAHAAQGRSLLPPGATVAELAAVARPLLGRARPCDRPFVAAGLPAILARRDLARLPGVHGVRGIGDRVAVLLGASRSVC